MKIAVCDDIEEQAFAIKGMLEAYARDTRRIEPEISVYTSSARLLAEFEPRKYELMLLDIGMPELSGMELAEKIRELDVDVQIAFVTYMEDKLPAGYKVMAAGFIVKPVTQEQLSGTVDRVVTYYEKKRGSKIKILLKGGKVTELPLHSTYYIEGMQHYLSAVTPDGKVEFVAKLSEMASSLAPHNFVQPHRSYLANMSYVGILKSNHIKLKNGTALPIGRKYADSVKEAYSKFWAR